MVDGSNAQLFPQYNLAQAGFYPDPSQWSNPYSSFQNGALPFPPGYAGTPTNAATGQPIQPPAGSPAPQQPTGTTLNSMPQSAGNPNFNAAAQADFNAGNAAGQSNLYALGYGPGGSIRPGSEAAMYGGGQQQQASPSMQPASQTGSYNNALSLLANPGNPTTPGSAFTPQQAQAGGGNTQGVLNNFLQNWQRGGIGQQAAPGIGGGSSGVSFGANNPFFAALGGKQ
jgi:hypothetical protein